jgi:hypothetical protein
MSTPFWKDKTLWLNVIAGILALVQVFSEEVWFPVGYQVFIVAVLNAVVRLLTGEPISGTYTATNFYAKIDKLTDAKATVLNKTYIRDFRKNYIITKVK